MKTKTEKRKITVQMWVPLLDRLNELTTAACLNRDAYLDVVLANEAPMLMSELEGKKNSDVARGFVKRCFLDLKDLRPVSLTLTAATADAMAAACDAVNVWRDVFVNRVAYLLVAKTSALENQWDIRFEDHRSAIFDEGWEIKALLLGPRLTAIRGFIQDDPFLGMRAALRQEYPDTGGAVHALHLGNPSGRTPKQRGLLGLSTYLEDAHVPGTPKNKEQAKWAAELLDLLVEETDTKKEVAK